MAEEARESTGARPAALLCVATAAGVGVAPLAPGTAGAAVGVVLCVPLAGLGPWLYALGTLALLSLGVQAADVAERFYGCRDDGRIVIDEVVGQLVALFPLVLIDFDSFWLPAVTGFVAFRVFDIWKPAPVRRVERLGGGAGVMLDDVAAGGLAMPLVAGVAWLSG